MVQNYKLNSRVTTRGSRSYSHSYDIRTSIEYEDEQAATEEISSQWRTYALLLDYKQFKSTRTIQKAFRGWRVRNWMKKRQHAAGVIQRCWRSYISKRHLLLIAQEKAQEHTLALYQKSSQKIQSVFRGWWSRKFVNNMFMLKEIQLSSIEDLLKSMIHRLRQVERNGELPGILTFKSHKCQSSVANILSTFKYRFFNRIVTMKWIINKTKLHSYREEFEKAKLYTWAPYAGFYSHPKSEIGLLEKDYDRQQHDVAQAYLKSQRVTNEQLEKLNLKHKEEHLAHLQKLYETKMGFCRDLIYSMKRWKVIAQENVDLSEKIIKQMGIQDYLIELSGMLESLYYLENCNCIRDSKGFKPPEM